jgi:molecular chaperone HscC
MAHIGIDLGTTNSLVAVLEDGGPRLLPNALGEVMTPSVVGLADDGKSLLVGRAARARLVRHPDLTAARFKRLMGTEKELRLGRKSYGAVELSAMVRKSLKVDAEAELGEPVTGAVISVPAYFNGRQRQATKDAAEIAGLTVLGLINEPTAAALAAGVHDRNDESTFIVLDLGGGTFDVSIVEMFEGVMEVRASSGDAVIPPFLWGLGRRIYAAILSFCAGVIPPLPMFGRSLL